MAIAREKLDNCGGSDPVVHNGEVLSPDAVVAGVIGTQLRSPAGASLRRQFASYSSRAADVAFLVGTQKLVLALQAALQRINQCRRVSSE